MAEYNDASPKTQKSLMIISHVKILIVTLVCAHATPFLFNPTSAHPRNNSHQNHSPQIHFNTHYLVLFCTYARQEPIKSNL